MIPHAKVFETYLFRLNLSHHTRRAYLGDLKAFWKRRHVEPGAITREHVEDWITSLQRAGASPKTVRRKAASLTTFFRALRRAGLTTANPTGDLDLPKIPDRVHDTLTPAELAQLVGVKSDRFEDQRAILAVELIYGTGMRVGELVRFTPGSIRQEEGTVRIIGKGDKERAVGITDRALAVVAAWLEAHPTDVGSPIMQSAERGPVHEATIRDDIRRLAKLAGLTRRVHPHLLRHTIAQQMTDRGADLGDVQAQLGHTDPKTTLVYTKSSAARLRRAMQSQGRELPPTA